MGSSGRVRPDLLGDILEPIGVIAIEHRVSGLQLHAQIGG